MQKLVAMAGIIMAGLSAAGAQADTPRLAVPVEVPGVVRPPVAVPRGPKLELSVHLGDVLLRTQADADRVCVAVIAGDLTVQPAPGEVISLPCLLQVQGDLNMRLPAAQHIAAAAAPDCGGAPCSNVSPGRVDAAQLRSVGGDVRVEVLDVSRPEDDLDEYVLFDAGLPALRRVGRDVEVDHRVAFGLMQGMQALDHIPGDVLFRARAYTGNTTALMPNVKTVAGDVVVEGDVYNLLPRLESAGALVLRDHYETLVETWRDVAFGGLTLDGVTLYYGLIANMVALDPGAALLVTADQDPSALRICALIEQEQAEGWNPVVWGFDPSDCED